jgi:hypothetical protein
MSTEDVFTSRVIVTLLAAGVVIFVGFALIKSVINGGKRVVWEILRVTSGLVCMALAALSGRGNIGAWGAWVGFGGVCLLLLVAVIAGRSRGNDGPDRKSAR